MLIVTTVKKTSLFLSSLLLLLFWPLVNLARFILQILFVSTLFREFLFLLGDTRYLVNPCIDLKEASF